MDYTFPNTETYLVNWMGGACGSFITTLLQDFVQKLSIDNVISSYGNAHANLIPINWNTKSSAEYFAGLHFNKDPISEYVVPRNPNNVLILYDHILPNWDQLFNVFPKCKNVIITIDQDDSELVAGNLFFKQSIQFLSSNADIWKTIRKNHECMSEHENPNDATLADIQSYIQEAAQGNIIHPIYSGKSVYPNQVFTISIKDIYLNPMQVLNTISKITSKPVIISNLVFYNKYLSKQKELIENKMPWLEEKYPISLLDIDEFNQKS